MRSFERLAPDPCGLVLGALMYSLALTPSLLPRTWLWQAVACGLSAATGYGLGVFLHYLWKRLDLGTQFRIGARARRIINVVIMVLTIAWLIVSNLFALRWQQEVAQLTGAQSYTVLEFLRVAPLALLLWMLLVALARGIAAAADWILRRTPEKWDGRIRYGVAWVSISVVGLFIVDSVIPGTIVGIGERVFSVRNTEIRADLHRPTDPGRSGSPASLNDWEGLGAYGTRFVGLGLDAAGLEEITGRPAREPIRVYAGLQHGKTDAERAERVVAELERTGARDREVLVVAATTGTGWVNPTFAQSVELLFDGDTAIAAAQYSYLPSALQFISSHEEIEEAGRALITTVVAWWKDLPENDRPRIYLYGESLGTTAGEGAFAGTRDIASSVDGALWVGPVNSNRIWRELVGDRDPGSPEIQPVYGGGEVVRFVQNSEEIESMDTSGWGPRRILYVQHPTDPVVWWSPSLMFREPDWLQEDPGFDRSPSMFWMPAITFFQISVDLPNAANVPNGHGHNYGQAVMDGFAAITGDPRFDAGFLHRAGVELDLAMRGQGPEKEIGVSATEGDG